MKLYIVLCLQTGCNHTEYFGTLGVFGSERKANSAIEQHKAKSKFYYIYEIVERELDAITL